MFRTTVSRIASAFIAAMISSTAALAETIAEFPSKPIHFIVGYAPGGATDTIARAIGNKLTEYWGQPVILEYRPGAATNIATEAVAQSPKDGYTLLLMTTANAINPTLYPNLRYDAVKDFALVTNLMKVPGIVVANKNLPIKNIPELIAYAKANPDKLTYSSPGVGSTHHLVAELFKKEAGIKLLHVPFKGAAPAMTATMGGHVDLYFGALVSTMPQVRNEALRALAVTSLHRVAVAQDIPTMDEQGLKNFETGAWYGVSVAGGTPPEIVKKLNEGIVRAMKDPAVARLFDAEGAEIVADTPQEFSKFFQSELEKWATAVRVSGANVQ